MWSEEVQLEERIEGVEEDVFEVGLPHCQQNLLHSPEDLKRLLLIQQVFRNDFVIYFYGNDDQELFVVVPVELEAFGPDGDHIRLIRIQVICLLIY